MASGDNLWHKRKYWFISFSHKKNLKILGKYVGSPIWFVVFIHDSYSSQEIFPTTNCSNIWKEDSVSSDKMEEIKCLLENKSSFLKPDLFELLFMFVHKGWKITHIATDDENQVFANVLFRAKEISTLPYFRFLNGHPTNDPSHWQKKSWNTQG